ncbi:hypothetical protein CHU98_g9103 [Xylaria longipes]|nr:hypothetical protein CHU98_g9103 [Xylaria longipes]
MNDDLTSLEQTLRDKYPGWLVDSEVYEAEDLTRIGQKDDESLSQYCNRIQGAVRQAGIRDTPKTPTGMTSRSSVEDTFLKIIISGFVNGLKNYDLRQEALLQRATKAKSLRECLEIIQNAAKTIANKAKAEAEHQERQKIKAIRKILYKTPDMSVQQAVKSVEGFAKPPIQQITPLPPAPTSAPPAPVQQPPPPPPQTTYYNAVYPAPQRPRIFYEIIISEGGEEKAAHVSASRLIEILFRHYSVHNVELTNETITLEQNLQDLIAILQTMLNTTAGPSTKKRKAPDSTPVADLLSPDFVRNLRHLSTRIGDRAKRTARRYAKMKSMVPTMKTLVIMPSNVYRVTPIIKFTAGSEVIVSTIRENSGQADQGSDVNLIHPNLVKNLSIPIRLLADIGVKSARLLDSNGQTTVVTEFVVFNITVMSITRSIWAMVQPPGGNDNTLVLLGLPWLWDVMASFDIRSSSLTIGDPGEGEEPVTLKGPVMSLGGIHKLTLLHGQPPDIVERHIEEVSDTDSDEENEGLYTDSEQSKAESLN